MKIKLPLKGLLIAPATPTIILSLLAVNNSAGFYVFFIFALFFMGIGYISAFFVGLPIHLILTKLSLKGLISYSIAGALSGIFPYLWVDVSPWFLNSEGKWRWENFGFDTLLGIMCFSSLSVAICFWFIERPDLQDNQKNKANDFNAADD